jgi:hypothetical protein
MLTVSRPRSDERAGAIVTTRPASARPRRVRQDLSAGTIEIARCVTRASQRGLNHMSNFPMYTIDTAPAESKEALDRARRAFGFVPNLLGILATSPAALGAYLSVSEAFSVSTFTEIERHWRELEPDHPLVARNRAAPPLGHQHRLRPGGVSTPNTPPSVAVMRSCPSATLTKSERGRMCRRPALFAARDWRL